MKRQFYLSILTSGLLLWKLSFVVAPTTPNSDIELVIFGDTSLCRGEFTTLQVLILSGDPPFTFEWFDEEGLLTNTPISNNTTLTIHPLRTTNYYVHVSSANDFLVEPLQVRVQPTPSIKLVNYECQPSGDPRFYDLTIRAVADTIFIDPPNLSASKTGIFDYKIKNIPSGERIRLTAALNDSDCTFEKVFQETCPSCIEEFGELEVNIHSTMDSICTGDSIAIFGKVRRNLPPYQFEWYENSEFRGSPIGEDSMLVVAPIESTTYFLRVYGACSVDEDSVMIKVAPLPTINIDSAICLNGTYNLFFTTDTINQIELSGSHTIDQIKGNHFVINGIPIKESISITVRSPLGCIQTLDYTSECCPTKIIEQIDQHPIALNCLPGEDLPIEIRLSPLLVMENGVKLMWYADSTLSNPPLFVGATFSFYVDTSTTLFLLAENQLGCQDTASITINLSQRPDLNIELFECNEDSLSYTIVGNTNGDEILFNTGNLFRDTLLDLFEISEIPHSMTLAITVQDTKSLCQNSISINPEAECCFPLEQLAIDAGRDCVLAGDTTQLFVQTNCDDCSFQWTPTIGLDFPNRPNPIATLNESSTYTVEVFDSNNCLRARGTIDISTQTCGPENIFLPNVFTPNGDQQNDELVLQLINVEKVEIDIYSRFGNQVVDFDWTLPIGAAADRGEDGIKPRKLVVWDGRINGKVQDIEVFAYVLKATCINGNNPVVYTNQGNITLLR